MAKQQTKTAATLPKVELRQIIGKSQDSDGRVRRAAHPVDSILLDGKEVGQVGHKPGVAVSLLSGALLTPKQHDAIMDAVAKARGNVRPAKIKSPPNVDLAQLLDDEPDDDTDEFSDE
jgi:hypothetical protein